MSQQPDTTTPEFDAEIRRRLTLHESLTGEMLDDLASEDWDTYQDGKHSFENYAEDYTWRHRSIFRIYLSSGPASEYLDVYVDDRLEPYRVVFHLELPAGGTSLRVSFGSPLFLYAAMALDAFGDFAY